MAPLYRRNRHSTWSVLVLLILVAAVASENDIHVTFDASVENVIAEFYGDRFNQPTVGDLARFGVTNDDVCLDRLAKVFKGNRPDYCYFGATDARWDKRQVFLDHQFTLPQIHYSVEDVTEIGRSRKKLILWTSTYKNNRKSSLHYFVTVKERREYENSVTHISREDQSWGAKAVALFTIKGLAEAGGILKYEHEWGNAYSRTTTESVKLGGSISVVVPPHDSVTVNITAFQIMTTFQITYVNSISGMVVADFPDKHDGHHYWGVDIGAILDAGPKRFKEIVRINHIYAKEINVH